MECALDRTEFICRAAHPTTVSQWSSSSDVKMSQTLSIKGPYIPSQCLLSQSNFPRFKLAYNSVILQLILSLILFILASFNHELCGRTSLSCESSSICLCTLSKISGSTTQALAAASAAAVDVVFIVDVVPPIIRLRGKRQAIQQLWRR